MEILDEATELLQPVYTDILTLSPLQEVLHFLLQIIRPQKVNYMFLRHRLCHFQPPRIKNFYCFPTDKCEKSSTHSELTVNN